MARKDLDNCKACGTQDCILVFFHNTGKNNSIKNFTPHYFNELDTTGDKQTQQGNRYIYSSREEKDIPENPHK